MQQYYTSLTVAGASYYAKILTAEKDGYGGYILVHFHNFT